MVPRPLLSSVGLSPGLQLLTGGHEKVDTCVKLDVQPGLRGEMDFFLPFFFFIKGCFCLFPEVSGSEAPVLRVVE